jgi:hypothetical protein
VSSPSAEYVLQSQTHAGAARKPLKGARTSIYCKNDKTKDLRGAINLPRWHGSF